nr:hypothetical protein [uncultured Sphingobacterium sp.]
MEEANRQLRKENALLKNRLNVFDELEYAGWTKEVIVNTLIDVEKRKGNLLNILTLLEIIER